MRALESEWDYVILGDMAEVLPRLPDGSCDLIYIDPPFNTGTSRSRTTLRTRADPQGDRVGFGGRRYRSEAVATASYDDSHPDYIGLIRASAEQSLRLLRASGTLYLHLDWRESHYAKVLLDQVFGRRQFLNEIIWAYDFGGRSKRRWPAKHDTILVYVKDSSRYFFDQDAVERIPYMAPGLVGEEKARRGKVPTDVWWHTIVPTSGQEKTGWPTQKPEGILRRIVEASCPKGGRVLDFFAGSGTTGAVAQKLGRRFVLVERSPEAMKLIRRRLGDEGVRYLDAGLEPRPWAT